ncbi:MAG: Ig-like domain-containing protein, partial [Rhodoglobus sp.]
ASSPSVSVINDSTLPTITVTSITPTPNGNGYNSSSPVTLVLTASAGQGIASISYSIDGGSTVLVLAPIAIFTVSGEGIHSLSFTATDTAANVSATGSATVRIDTVAPVAPSTPALAAASDSGSSSSDGITKVVAPIFTGTAETGTTVTLYDGAVAVGSTVATSGSYSIQSSTLTNATHTISARSTDAAGNVSPSSGVTSVTIDTVAPSAPPAPTLTAASDSGSSSSDRNTNVTTPTFVGTAEAGSTVTLYNSTTVIGTGVATGGNYSITSSALTAGTKSITVAATDLAGNLGVKSQITTVVIDITAPGRPGTPTIIAAHDTGRSSTDSNTSVTTPTFAASAATGTVLITLLDAGVAIGTAPVSGTSYSITSPALTNGVHPITTRATDLAGNISVVSTARSVTIDTIAPAAPTIVLSAASDTGKSNSDRITRTTTPTFTGVNESRAIVTIYDGGVAVGTVTTTATTYSKASTTLADGVHTMTASSTDIAGNLGPQTAGLAITIDTVAPLAPSAPVLATASDTGVSSTDGITKATTPTLVGTAEAGITVALFDGAVATGASVTATGGAYSAVTATLAQGVHALIAVPTDVAGNVGPSSGTTSVTVDTTVPTVTLNQAVGQADPTTASPVLFTAIFSEDGFGLTDSDITFSGTATGAAASVGGSGTVWTISVSGMTKTGTVIPRVPASVAQDLAGNLNTVSTSTDVTVTYNDTTAPTVPITEFVAVATQAVRVSGTASTAPGDGTAITVVICTVNVFPCVVGNTKATLNTTAVSGAWTVTSATLGTFPVLYARATQIDLSANTGASVAGPIAV